MAKRSPAPDFRSLRAFLPDEVFLFVNGPRPGPTDLISEDVWNGIMHLPDDVALVTSNHHGRQLAALRTLWGDWIEATGDNTEEPLFAAMLDATDCFQSSTFDALHGYYRSSLSNLRSAIDLVAIGTVGNLVPTDRVYARWKGSSARLIFPREHLRRITKDPVSTLLFKQGGWIDLLYERLSGYSHSRPDSSDGAMWRSNGPIYVGSVFNEVFRLQAVTYAACYLMVKTGRSELVLPASSKFIFETPIGDEEILWAREALFADPG
jgi:hypothetical protein